MKTRITLLAIGAIGIFTFGSCKKNYTCTCTTVVSTVSSTTTHNVDNSTYTDAKNTCNNYQTQANSTLPGGTTCHL